MSDKGKKPSDNVLVLCDDRGSIYNFIKKTIESSRFPFLRISPETRVHNNWERFKDSRRFVIWWESEARIGGAVVEEILEVEPLFDLNNRLIVVTSTQSYDNMVYCKELGIQNVIEFSPNGSAINDEKARFLEMLRKDQKLNPAGAWNRIFVAIEHLGASPSEQNLQKIRKAVDNLRRSSQDDNRFAHYLYVEGCLLALSHDPAGAMAKWEQAIVADPNHFRSHNRMIQELRRQGQPEKALELSKKMQSVNKKSLSRLSEMGEIYLDLADNERAEHYFKLVLEKDSYFPAALNGMAEVSFDRGDLSQARSLLQKSSKASIVASKLNRTGIELVKAKHYEEALQHYSDAQYILPTGEKGALIFYNMGLCCAKWQKYDLASEYLKIALIKDPNYEKAKKLLGNIKNQLAS